MNFSTILQGIRGTMEDRGYIRCEASYRLTVSDDSRYTITAHGYSPDNDGWSDMITATGYGETYEKALAKFNENFEKEFPHIADRRRADLNKALEQAARLADALGDTMLAYAAFAEVLREHMRSNLLEDKS